MTLWEAITGPWPWYVAGPLIAGVYLLLLYFGRSFGISGSLRAMCSALGAGRRVEFFRFDWKGQTWNLLFVAGTLIGGFVGHFVLAGPEAPGLSEAFTTWAEQHGLESWRTGLAPVELFTWEALLTPRGLILMVGGGFLVGFGSRYAGGCTSGHAISGLSNLQLPSLVAVIGFFIGGLLVTWFLMPHILAL